MNNPTQGNLNKHMRQERKGETKTTLEKKIESAPKTRLNCNLESEIVQTIESQKELANVGKLLGLVLVDNEKATFRRIKRSL